MWREPVVSPIARRTRALPSHTHKGSVQSILVRGQFKIEKKTRARKARAAGKHEGKYGRAAIVRQALTGLSRFRKLCFCILGTYLRK